MKMIFALDSFKGSLSSKRISEILTKAAGEVFDGCECVPVILADGGKERWMKIFEQIRKGENKWILRH